LSLLGRKWELLGRESKKKKQSRQSRAREKGGRKRGKKERDISNNWNAPKRGRRGTNANRSHRGRAYEYGSGGKGGLR